MKVKDILPLKHEVESEFKRVQLLENIFKNNPELAEENADKADCNYPLGKLMTEVRMRLYDVLKDIETKIENAEIQKN